MKTRLGKGLLARAGLAMAVASGWAMTDACAQVPVIDSATLSQATTTATNTSSIMQTNQSILTTVQQTLAAVSGNRTTGAMGSAALGSGFSMSGMPDLSSILGGGQMSWGSLGSFAQVASTVINSLNLVKSLSGNSSGSLTGTDNAYQGAVNTATALTGIISGAQSAATARSTAFTAAGGQIGSAADIKGSIDQNSQLQVQTALTINEVIGAISATNSALNAQALQDLATQAKAAQVMSYDPTKAQLVAP